MIQAQVVDLSLSARKDGSIQTRIPTRSKVRRPLGFVGRKFRGPCSKMTFPVPTSTCFEYTQPPSWQLASKSVMFASGKAVDRR